MAKLIDHIQIHIANTDLAVERQNILRDTIKDAFDKLNIEDPSKERSLLFVINHDGAFLPNVLRANTDADVIFTGFNVERKVKVRKKKDLILDESQSDVLQIDPTLRFPAYQEMHKIVQRGEFRLRRLILVGDINVKIRDLFRLGFKIEVTLFTDEERSKVYPPLLIESLEQLPKLGAEADENQINLSKIDRIQIADIAFDGIINMAEVANQFVIKDDSIHDTIQKVFELEGVKETIALEAVEEEKLLFVRKKKVMLVLDPDLKKVVANKLKFDKMEKVFEYSSKEEAFQALETGKTESVIEFLESEGYEILNDVLSTVEKDVVLIALLGRRLMPSYLDKEFKIQGSNLKLLPKNKIEEIFNLFPEPFVDRLLKRLQEKNFESFLSRIPTQIREPIVMDFLGSPKKAAKVWQVLDEPEKVKVLAENTVEILALLNLSNTDLFQEKFPDVKFSGEHNGYHSSKYYDDLDDDEKRSYLSAFRDGLSGIKMNKNAWENKFSPEQLRTTLGGYIAYNTQGFYSKLSPVLKKQMWSIVGRSGGDAILSSMHYLDKAAIMENSQEHMLQFVVKESNYLISMVRRGEALELGGKCLLGLKQFNRVESKTGLFKKITQNSKLRPHRIEGLTQLLSSTQGRSIYEKLVQQIEALNTGYDSLICVSQDVKELKAHESLMGATVTLVDELVDSSLLKMFQESEVDVDDYDKYAAEIEKKIAELKSKLAKSGMDDPVGGYLLESMVVLMNMASQAVRNELDESMIEVLDERELIRDRVISGMKQNMTNLEKQLKQNNETLPRLESRQKDQLEKLKVYTDKVNKKLGSLQQYLKKFEDTQENLQKCEDHKRRVALMQRNLSLEFFNLIKPMILSELRSLPPALENALYYIRDRFFPPLSMRRRIIFKFTDDELRKIAKKNIAFISDDEQLKRFIFTCLKIDRVENRLFHIAGSNNLPESAGLLFVGTDVMDHDFSSIANVKHIHPFSDEKFYATLVKNEQFKKKTKENLTKFGKHAYSLKQYLEKEGRVLKDMTTTRNSEEKVRKTLEQSKKQMETDLKKDQETLSFLSSEKETMDEKFKSIDAKFQTARESITKALSDEGSTVDSIEKETQALSQELSASLMDISQEMANMMFIKNVKDAVTKISKQAQSSIVSKMDQLSKYTGGRVGIKTLVIANDGSLDSTNLKRVMSIACSEHFEFPESEIVNMSIGRMENSILAAGQKHSFLIIIGDDRDSRLKTYQIMIKKLKEASPQTHIILFSPYDSKHSSKLEELIENMNALRDYCMLVNTDIIDYTNKNRLLQFLNEVAPV